MTKADSPLVSTFVASPNHELRMGDIVDIIVLHYTGMESAAAAQRQLCDPAAKVSSHYLVNEDGSVVQMVEESRRAYHAGVSSWHGEADINSHSIGIEIVNGGHDYGTPDFPPRQIDAVIRLCCDIQSRWPIPQANVVAHSDIAPSRKRDPGEKFPWHKLYRAGVGLWVKPEPVAAGRAFRLGDRSDAVADLKMLLREYGYGTDTAKEFHEAARDVVTAFQRHFRPERVDGIADVSTVKTLAKLLKLRQTKSS